MRFLLIFLIIPILLPGSYAQATEYTFEITWTLEETTDIQVAGFRLYDFQKNEICSISDPDATTLICTVDITGNEGTYTLVSYSTGGIESDPSTPFTINFESTLPDELAAVMNVTTTEGSLAVTFDAAGSTGTIIGYSWEFNDGSAPVITPVTNHTFAAPGTYTVSLTVQGENGVTDTATREVTVNLGPDENQAPIASLVVTSSVIGDVPLTVTFDASGSTDHEDTNLAYFWDFGDGTTIAGSELATHQYLIAGTYTTTVTVTDSQSASDSADSQPIMVTDSGGGNLIPAAAITVIQISDTIPALVSFSGTNSSPSEQDGSITDYSWNFGDGSTGTGSNVQHVYSDPGNYTVQLTVTDNLGKQAVTAKAIQAPATAVKPIIPVLIQIYQLLLPEN